jgi:uncharacterized protein YkwD
MKPRQPRFVHRIASAAIAALTLASFRPHLSAQQYYASSNLRPEVNQILALANQARAQAGAGPVRWDPTLAAAALSHCRLMAQQGEIEHRYQGEPDISYRAAQAGAHFSIVEENIAVAPTAPEIHELWMNSPGHRTNLLNPDIDSIGIAVVAARGSLYVVADYSRAVQLFAPEQVEQQVATLVQSSGIAIFPDATLARQACTVDDGMPRATPGSPQPTFIMRWQGAELNQLPPTLVERLQTGKYRQAAVGSCPTRDLGGPFTAYRLAVLLY